MNPKWLADLHERSDVLRAIGKVLAANPSLTNHFRLVIPDSEGLTASDRTLIATWLNRLEASMAAVQDLLGKGK